MSRKFNRTENVKKEATQLVNEVMKTPQFWQQVLQPKPRWIPHFLWKKVLKLVLR